MKKHFVSDLGRLLRQLIDQSLRVLGFRMVFPQHFQPACIRALCIRECLLELALPGQLPSQGMAADESCRIFRPEHSLLHGQHGAQFLHGLLWGQLTSQIRTAVQSVWMLRPEGACLEGDDTAQYFFCLGLFCLLAEYPRQSVAHLLIAPTLKEEQQ
jgi:hypothetical protein